MSVFARPSTPLPIVYELGGGGVDRARVVCGFLGCDERPYNPLLTALPPMIHLNRPDNPTGEPAHGIAQPGTLEHNRETTERAAILRALEKVGFSRTRAAQMLGVSRVTLYKKMRK